MSSKQIPTSDARVGKGGDVVLHGPLLVLSPEEIAGGPGGGAYDGGDVLIQGGHPGGKVILVVPQEDPHIRGVLYASEGLLHISEG